MDSGQVESTETEWNWEDSLLSAIQLGLSIFEYDEMTPYELMLFAEVHAERTELEHEEKLVLVWLGEYYHRVKKLPSLKEVLGKKNVTKKPQMSDDQMFKAVQILNQKFGGKFESSS